MAIYFDNSNIITGSRGPEGPQGIQGSAGPNEVTGETATTLNGLLKGSSGTVSAAIAGIDFAPPPILRTATLGAASWIGEEAPFSQTVTVNGVLADETKQAIHVSPSAGYGTMYGTAGIECTAQAENALTFSCETTPENDITVNIVIQEAGV